MRKFALLLLTFLPLKVYAQTTCFAVTPAGAGSKNGTSWNNACAGFAGACAGSALIHGDRYYLAGGSGSGYNFPSAVGQALVNITSTGTNTSSILWIGAATIADHGQSSSVCTNNPNMDVAGGWVQATYAVDGGAGQAIFTTQSNTMFEFSTPNTQLDGNYYPAGGDTDSNWGNGQPGKGCGGTQCGIKLDFSGASNSFQNTHTMNPYYISSGLTPEVDNTIIRSTELAGCYSTCGLLGELWDGLHINGAGGNVPQNTIATHNYWHDSSQGFVASQGDTGTTLKYNYLYKNFSHAVSPAIHGNIWTPQGGTGQVIAYNVIQDCQGTAVFDVVNSGTPFTVNNVQLYGNIILMSNGNPFSMIGGYDDGIVACTNSNICTNMKVYNNTVINESISTSNRLDGGSPVGTGSSIDVRNNLFYLSTPAVRQGSGAWTASYTYDYNYYSSTTHTVETNEQTTSVNPFVNWPAYTIAGFQLQTDTNAWNAVGAPYNVDMTGLTRTSSRGALQFASGVLPLICITPSPANFAPSQILTLTVTNCGSAPETLSTPYFTITGTNAADFTNTGSGSCANGGTIGTSASCTATVQWVPGGTGTRTATFNIFGTANGSVTLTGFPAPSSTVGGTSVIGGAAILH
jgi:hypothetical protein